MKEAKELKPKESKDLRPTVCLCAAIVLFLMCVTMLAHDLHGQDKKELVSTVPTVTHEQVDKWKDYEGRNKDAIIKLQSLALEYDKSAKDQEALQNEMRQYLSTLCQTPDKKFHYDPTKQACTENK